MKLEGYSKNNPDKNALKSANQIIETAKKNPQDHKVLA